MADTVLVVGWLLVLAVLAAGVCRRLPLPESVVLVLAGIALAELARRWPPAAPLTQLRLSPELVFFVLLPALVFESGLNIDVRRLLKNLAPVLALAVPALILSTALIGAGLAGAAGMDLSIALLFGALISATDPVAVVALFREMGAPARLTVLVEGESLFNDATAIVVFGLLLAFVVESDAPGAGALLAAVPEFLRVFVGGAVLGVVAGALTSEIVYRLRGPTVATLAMSLAAAYLGFIVAEHGAHVSGVMAAVGASITFGALGITRLSGAERQGLRETWELLAFGCNALLFLLVGLSVDLRSLLAHLPLIAIAVVLVHVARAGSVYALVPLTTRAFALPRVSLGDRHVMWWGGLKGGLAIAMALTVPLALPERQLILDVTVGVVLFTLLVNAPTLRPVMRLLRRDRLSADERAELDDALGDARGRVQAELDGYRRHGLLGAEAHHALADRLAHALVPRGEGARTERALRAAHLAALNAEASALAALYESRAIDQYTYLELRDLLVRDRETPPDAHGERDAGSQSLFERIEAAGLRWLRERDWAVGLLSRYQDLRLAQHLERTVAGIVMAEEGAAALAARDDAELPAVAGLLARYRERAARRHARLAELRGEFPALYRRFETSTFARAALVETLHFLAREHEHGKLGTKPWTLADAQVRAALEAARAREIATAPISAADRIADVGLFRGLSPSSLEALAGQCRPLTFLPGDEIIGEGEHGDALYLITRGHVTVTRRDAHGEAEPLATLGDGEFFGEAALLGDPVRNATVVAAAPVTALRLTRRDVLALVERWPEIGERLRAADRVRRPDEV